MQRPSDTIPRRATPLATPLANLGLTVAALLFCLLAGEIAVRASSHAASLWRFPNYIERETRPDPEHEAQMRYEATLGHEPIPGFKGTLAGKPISFSADGLREHDLAAPPPAGPPILAVGDSFTEGYLVGNDETWPAHLQRLTGRPVLNAGVRAYGLDQIVLRTAQIVLRTAHLVPRLKPATIVLGMIPDDVERTELDVRYNRPKPYFVLANSSSGDGLGGGLALRNVPVPKGPVPMSLWRRVLGYSYLADTVMRRAGLYYLWYGINHHIQHDGDAVSCRLMARFAGIVRGAGAQGLVVAFYEDVPWRDAAEQAAERKRMQAVLACAARAGLAALDTWDGFAAAGAAKRIDELYYGSHFTDAGAAVAARLVAAALPAK